MSSIRTITCILSAPLASVRSYLPSEKKARRAIARHFAAAIARKAPAPSAPGFWPWSTRIA